MDAELLKRIKDSAKQYVKEIGTLERAFKTLQEVANENGYEVNKETGEVTKIKG